MKIQINNKDIEVPENFSISDAISLIGTSNEGIAVAVNDTVIPRSRWSTYSFKANDNILIIKATRGG